MQMPFGKHRGAEIYELPDSYLEWLLDNVDLRGPLLAAVLCEMQLREDGQGHKRQEYREQQREQQRKPPGKAITISVPKEYAAVVSEVVNRGYRACAMLAHPDAGGSHERMQQLNAAVALLRESLPPV